MKQEYICENGHKEEIKKGVKFIGFPKCLRCGGWVIAILKMYEQNNKETTS